MSGLGVAARIHAWLVADDVDPSDDVPDSLVERQPANFLRHVVSLVGTKSGDGLLNPKLVLSALLGLVGAPLFMVGLLVPIREAGSLLPQVLIADAVGRRARRRAVWASFTVVQGLAVASMAFAAWRFEGALFGWWLLSSLFVFALARSVCSVAYKDVLGKTLARGTRGTATGTAANVAAFVTLVFGVVATFGPWSVSAGLLAVALATSAALFVFAGFVFLGMAEEPEPRRGDGVPWYSAWSRLSLLREDVRFRRFVLVRALFVSTALAPPYMVALAGREVVSSFGFLGPLIIASALAGTVSGTFWGRASDRSSRRTLVAVGVLGAGAMAATASIALVDASLFATFWAMPALLFVLMLSYEGVRVGRATHLVDMAPAERRAHYTAVANTAIGLVLMAAAGFGLVAARFGEGAVLALFAAMAAAGSLLALGLDEAQRPTT